MTLRTLSTALLLSLAGLGCNGPFGLLPGGQLDGDVAVPPASWSAGEFGTAQLETRPEEPYSVNIAYTVMRGSVYVNAGDTETRWVANMMQDPRVRLRVDGNVYELRAERVSAADEIAEFAALWTGQSYFRRDPLGYDEVYLYRLVAR